MNNRLKSAIGTVLIQGALAYGLITGLAMSFAEPSREKMAAVELPQERPPPAPQQQPVSPNVPRMSASSASFAGKAVVLGDWSAASPAQRNEDFMKATKWVRDNMPEEERRLLRWREALPQGSGPGKVARLRPPNLATHTLYWPEKWSKGRLPIVAWGNGKCNNSSLAYAGFLSEIASHGYFVVAVGNDDIDYPQPEGLTILADGRPVRTQASALTRAVDWAVAENGRAGGPYAGRLDTGKIAYMGHDCGGRQALDASSDPRATTTVMLNASASFRPDAARGHKAPLAHFEGAQDDGGVLDVGEANFARAEAAGWPMVKAALGGMGHDGAYAAPNRSWSKAVVAWLDWQLKGDGRAATTIDGLARNGWSRVAATGLTGVVKPELAKVATPEPVKEDPPATP